MNKKLINASVKDALYFSIVSFIIFWLASFLYEKLQKTTGSLNMGIVLTIVLGLTLIIFFLAITNIVLTEHSNKRIKYWERIIAVVLFLIISAVILGVLGFLFLFEV